MDGEGHDELWLGCGGSVGYVESVGCGKLLEEVVSAKEAVAGKDTAFDGGMGKVIVELLKIIVGDGDVLMGFDGGVFNGGIVAVLDEVIEWFDVIRDETLLDVFDE